MKRFLTICLCLILCLSMLTGCRRRIRRRHRIESPVTQTPRSHVSHSVWNGFGGHGWSESR